MVTECMTSPHTGKKSDNYIMEREHIGAAVLAFVAGVVSVRYIASFKLFNDDNNVTRSSTIAERPRDASCH